MQEPIDFNNPTAEIRQEQQNTNDPADVRMGRIYGDSAEMLRLHNAYRPNEGGKYDLPKIMRKRADYELRQLQNSLMRERIAYAEKHSLSIPELEVRISESPEIIEQIFQTALDKLPKQCKTIIGNTQLVKPKKETVNE